MTIKTEFVRTWETAGTDLHRFIWFTP